MRKHHLSLLGGACVLLAGCTIPFESLLPGGPPSAAHPVESQVATSGSPGAAAEVSIDALLGSDWIVDDPAYIARDGGRTPTLRFLEGDRVSGTGGCNRFSGQASVERGVAHLGPVGATRMACRGSVADTEARFFQALEATRGARLEGGRLVFLDGAGKPLARFIRADPVSAAGDTSSPAGAAGASAGAAAGPGLAEAAAARGVTFLGRGNEPGWRLEIGPGDFLRVVYDYGMARADFPSLVPSRLPNGETVYEGASGLHKVRVTLQPVACRDDMSGEAYPVTVLLRFDGQERRGCGGPLSR